MAYDKSRNLDSFTLVLIATTVDSREKSQFIFRSENYCWQNISTLSVYNFEVRKCSLCKIFVQQFQAIGIVL